jgi:hypothetical protein
LEAARKARKTRTTRRATNPRQLRCTACNLFVRHLCRNPYEPCGVCPVCCPGHKKPPAEQQHDGGRFTTSVEKA